MNNLKIIQANKENISEFAHCGYKNPKQEGFINKVDWLKKNFELGLKYQVLIDDEGETAGMIEYLPGEFAWRPVEAKGYLFIHCVVIFPRKYKQKGYGIQLLKKCIDDAKTEKKDGVAVVTRKGTWMAGKELFINNGFEVVDMAPPDFELLALRLERKSPLPRFSENRNDNLQKYKDGLHILYSNQCPYITKAINEIGETAQKDYKIKANIIELKTYQDAQNSPGIYGTFCMIYNGKIVAENPISNTRFKNIMKNAK